MVVRVMMCMMVIVVVLVVVEWCGSSGGVANCSGGVGVGISTGGGGTRGGV